MFSCLGPFTQSHGQNSAQKQASGGGGGGGGAERERERRRMSERKKKFPYIINNMSNTDERQTHRPVSCKLSFQRVKT